MQDVLILGARIAARRWIGISTSSTAPLPPTGAATKTPNRSSQENNLIAFPENARSLMQQCASHPVPTHSQNPKCDKAHKDSHYESADHFI